MSLVFSVQMDTGESEPTIFGERMADFRRSHLHTQDSFALAVGVSSSIVKKWEGSFRTKISLTSLRLICQTFNIQPAELLNKLSAMPVMSARQLLDKPKRAASMNAAKRAKVDKKKRERGQS